MNQFERLKVILEGPIFNLDMDALIIFEGVGNRLAKLPKRVILLPLMNF